MTDQGFAGDRDQLVRMLQQASELEHALTCEYLYAAFTLRAGNDLAVPLLPDGSPSPALTPSQATLCAHWNEQITKIAAQEMYHLMLASNLLAAIGDDPHLNRRNFPQAGDTFGKINLPTSLTSFDAGTVHRFMCWEKPEEEGWWDDDCKACAAAANERAGFSMLAAEQAEYDTIGGLYGLIDDALRANPTWIDRWQASRQVTSLLVPFDPPVSPIVGYGDAHEHIEEIVREGEGTNEHDTQAHFAFFHQIRDELGNSPGYPSGAETGSGPPFVPAWPTVDNPAYDSGLAAPKASLITDPTAAPIGLLFNQAYLLLLRTLSRLFLPTGETDPQRQALANAAMAFMPLVIKPLGQVLARTPAGAEYPGKYAGPSFELPEAIELPTGEMLQAWGGLYEEMAQLTSRARALSVRLEAAVPGLELVAAHLETILPLFAFDAEAVR